jgi:hypothetical protein
MTTYELNSNDDIIDVRDIIERFEELETEMPDDDADVKNWPRLHEWTAVGALLSDLCGNGGDEQWRGDWYPVTLIRDSYFEQSMDEMVADCYTLPELPSFMTVTLDYVALQMDYTSTEIDGVTYWYR